MSGRLEVYANFLATRNQIGGSDYRRRFFLIRTRSTRAKDLRNYLCANSRGRNQNQFCSHCRRLHEMLRGFHFQNNCGVGRRGGFDVDDFRDLNRRYFDDRICLIHNAMCSVEENFFRENCDKINEKPQKFHRKTF